MMQLAATAAAAGAVLSPNVRAFAQERAASGLEEIIVTAQRREESMQAVPIAVTPLTAKELDARGITGLAGLAHGAVPTVSVINFAGRPAELQYSIRGIGETDPSQPSFESGVALYLDGVYIARRQGSGMELADLERIEVLRGPQGTLFGRNAVGGAINMTTKKPTGEWGFKTVVEGGNYDYRRIKATLNTQEFLGLKFKFDVLHSERGAFTNNAAAGQGNWGENWQNGIRAAVRWQPIDALTVDYSYDKERISFIQLYNQLIHNTTVSPLFTSLLAPYVELDRNLGTSPAPGLYAPYSRSEVSGHSLIAQWQLSPDAVVKSISAYRDLHDNNHAINGFGILAPNSTGFGSPPPAILGNSLAGFALRNHQIQQEFQLIGSYQRLSYTLGVGYFREYSLGTALSQFGTGFYSNGAGGFTPALLPTPFTTPPTETAVDSKSVGTYGQVTWTPPLLSDRLHLTGGLRYSADDKTVTREVLNGAPVNVPVRVTEHRVDPAATVAFDILEDVSTYLRYATAYRGGGASIRELPYTAAQSPTGVGDPIGLHGFGPEKVKTYEWGFKSELLDHRLRTNAALFYSQLDGHQISLQTPAGVASTRVFNVPESILLKGAELEVTLVPVTGLTLSGGVTWLKKTQPDTVLNPITGQQTPFQISQYPANRYSANAQYQFPKLPVGTLSARVGVTGSSSYCFNDVSCVQYPDLKGGKHNDLIDARITLSDIELGAHGGALQIALWGQNLSDQKYYTFGFTVPGLNTGVIDYGEPRTYGASLTYEF